LSPPLAPALTGELVALEPLAAGHADALWRAAQPEEIWAWFPVRLNRRATFERWLSISLADAAAAREGVFAIVDRQRGEAVGSTRFMTVRADHRGLEIGGTWLAPSAWSTGVNAEAKLLLLEHAFEHLRCQRVEFKTDARNARSRAALLAIGARYEGILRKHMIMEVAGVRDSAYYSVLDEEWPAVRAGLQERLAARRGTA
jgi:RimJ/RimL family protein N-acetyltransferase